MSHTHTRDLWFCVDCTIVECNGDWSGIEDIGARHAEIQDGLDRLTANGSHVSPNWDSETEEGIRSFSRCGCDCCGSPLAGEMHRFALFSPESPSTSGR